MGVIGDKGGSDESGGLKIEWMTKNKTKNRLSMYGIHQRGIGEDDLW